MMPPDKRDPRVEPRVGDQLKNGRQWRQVSGIVPGVRYMTNSGKDKWVPMYTWQSWAKNAEVLHAAD